MSYINEICSLITKYRHTLFNAFSQVYQQEFVAQELKSDTEETMDLSQEVKQLREEEQRIKQQIAKFSGIDPETTAEMSRKAQVR